MKYNTEFSNLALEDKFLGYATTYDLCVTFLAEYDNQNKTENKSNLWSEYFVEDLEEIKKHIENIVKITKKYENTDFGKMLITNPNNLCGPAGKEKLKLGYAHIQLIIATLGNRLNNIIGKLFRNLEPTNENCFKLNFNYKQSNLLTEFGKELLPEYKYFNDDLIDEVNDKMIKLCQMAQKYKVKIPTLPRGDRIVNPPIYNRQNDSYKSFSERKDRNDYRSKQYTRENNFKSEPIIVSWDNTPTLVSKKTKEIKETVVEMPTTPGSVCVGPWGDIGKLKEIKETLQIEKILRKPEKKEIKKMDKNEEKEEEVIVNEESPSLTEMVTISKKEKVEDEDGWVSYEVKEIKKMKKKIEEEKTVIDEEFEFNASIVKY
jgi:hypothetical protein